MDAELQGAIARLKPGWFAYDPEPIMRQGQKYRVLVRVSPEAKQPSTPYPGTPPVVESIRTSGVMTAELEHEPESFHVQRIGSARQPIVPPFTDWQWDVTPLKSGRRNLNVVVTAVIRLSDGTQEESQVVVKTATISVSVNPLYVAGEFWASHWEFVLGSPLFVALVFWVAKRRGKKGGRRRIGF